MTLIVPGRGAELNAVVTEAITHRDNLIVQQIGRTTVSGALEEQALQTQMLDALTDDELNQFSRQALTIEDVAEEAASPLFKYDEALHKATIRIKDLFELVHGYRFGFVNPGELTLDRGQTVDPAGMTTLTLTCTANTDLRISKKVNITSINPQIKPAASSIIISQEVALADQVIAEMAITRLKQVNQILGET